ncbi:MAG: bacillithiol system redox-active protein YtxJ [Bacteroidota bacterium]
MIQPLNDENYPLLLTQDGPLVLYKHSHRCPISAGAQRRLRTFALEHPAVPVYEVNVIDQRDLSQQIAADFGIDHQSPQAFLLQRGRVVWHDSHGAITGGAVEDALADLDGADLDGADRVGA